MRFQKKCSEVDPTWRCSSSWMFTIKNIGKNVIESAIPAEKAVNFRSNAMPQTSRTCFDDAFPEILIECEANEASMMSSHDFHHYRIITILVRR